MSKGNKFTLFKKKAGKKKAGKQPFTFGKASSASKKAAKAGGY